MSAYLEIQCIECDTAQAYPASTKRLAEKLARSDGWSKTKHGWRCWRHKSKAKYNNRKITIDGHLFDSIREAERYTELRMLEANGAIGNLELQPSFELIPAFAHNGKKERPTVYKADFTYFDFDKGCTITEDVKGVRNPTYRLKRKLLLYRYPHITFLET